MKKYKSHKIVEADKIAELVVGASSGELALFFADKTSRVVSAEYVNKHKPQVGGYYVRYADGYESFSPADAFESGYTPVDEASVDGPVEPPSDVSQAAEHLNRAIGGLAVVKALIDLKRIASVPVAEDAVEGVFSVLRKELGELSKKVETGPRDPGHTPVEMPESVRDLLSEVANSFENEGCDGCGTIEAIVIDKVRLALGWSTLADVADEEDDEAED